jgi:hypothetical protein
MAPIDHRSPVRPQLRRMRRVALAVVALAAASAAPGLAAAPHLSARSLRSDTPLQILVASAAALRSAHSFEADGYLTEGKQRGELRLLSAGRSIDLSFRDGQASFEALATPNSAYVRASAAFYMSTGATATAAQLLSGRWLHTTARSALSGFAQFVPATLAACMAEDSGTVTQDGTATVDGRPAVLIREAGDVPGGQANTIAVASSGPPYPLEIISAGSQRPGGHVDACNNGKGSAGGGKLTFSRFNAVPPLVPPAHAINVPTGSHS